MHKTFRLLHHRFSPVLIVRRWQRGNGQLVGPLFYDATKANRWMQRHLADL